MKAKKFKLIVPLILVFISTLTLLISCDKSNDDPDNTVSPVWIYATGEDPYQSTPCVAGEKVIVCTLPRDGDDITLPGTHCIDRNTGTRIWKINDSVNGFLTSPLIYNNLVLEGGQNPHARRLSDGVVEWKYVDDLIPRSMYSNPLIVGDAVYFACMFHMIKLNAGSGAEVWQTDGFYNNLRSSSPVYKAGSVYYADASYSQVTSFDETSGQVEWAVAFENAFANKPLITDNEFYVGIQDSDINTKTLRCMNLTDRTEKWGVKLGTIMSDLALANGKIYAIGMQTLHCRSAADGSAIWQYELPAGAVSEPLVTGNKLFLGYGKGLVCLDAGTGELLWQYKAGNGNTLAGFSSPTLSGDKIYVSCSDGNVYCFNIN
jgi:outer membrane protein assembly factor BamB